MLVGSITGIAHGISLPLLMLVFGELINSFISQEQSDLLASCLNVSRSCSQDLIGNFSCSQFGFSNYSFTGTLDSFMESTFGEAAECVTDDEFIDQVVLYCIYFVAIAAAVFFFAYIENFVLPDGL